MAGVNKLGLMEGRFHTVDGGGLKVIVEGIPLGLDCANVDCVAINTR